MSMHYDPAIFEKYRALAVTRLNDLVPGRTYYSNSGVRETFVLESILKYEDAFPGEKASSGLKDSWWIVTEDGRRISAADSNIEHSYNPWLIFETQEDAENCEKELVITYYQDPDDFYYDDTEGPWYDDYDYSEYDENEKDDA